MPVPSVGVSLLQDGVVQLSCDGDTTGAGPVSYTWREDGNETPNVTEKLYVVTVRCRRVSGAAFRNQVQTGTFVLICSLNVSCPGPTRVLVLIHIPCFQSEHSGLVHQRGRGTWVHPSIDRTDTGSGSELRTEVQLFVFIGF